MSLSGDLTEPARTLMAMSLRDYFAGKAMAGFLAAPVGKFPMQINELLVVRDAYTLADAMLAERAKAKP